MSIRDRYRRAGVAVFRALQDAPELLALVEQSMGTEARDAWSRLIEEWRANYREARAQWNRRRSDGQPSEASREVAAELLERTSAQMREAMRELAGHIRRIPPLVRAAQAAGLWTHVEALDRAAEGAGRAVRAGLGALGAGAVLGLGVLALVLLGGRR